METELVKMSPKGQLVVPQRIREMEAFKSGDRFVSVAVQDGVLFKKVEIPDVKLEFKKLAKQIQTRFKKQGIRRKDVEEAIKWARKK